MKKYLTIILILTAITSCKKDEPAKLNSPTVTTNPASQTKTLPVYLSPIPLDASFGGVPPMVKITESGTTNESVFIVNTCDNVNGNTFTVTYGKSYKVTFGLYVDGEWTQYGGFTGTMTIASDGQISGLVGAGSEIGVTKGTDFQGCGFTIGGEILLFY